MIFKNRIITKFQNPLGVHLSQIYQDSIKVKWCHQFDSWDCFLDDGRTYSKFHRGLIRMHVEVCFL